MFTPTSLVKVTATSSSSITHAVIIYPTTLVVLYLLSHRWTTCIQTGVPRIYSTVSVYKHPPPLSEYVLHAVLTSE